MAKNLDIWGTALVFLSAFIELFVLSTFSSIQLNGYITWMMENQSYTADMLKHIALGVDTGDLDQSRFSESRSNIKLFSQTYDWSSELFWSRLVVGATFVVGAVMVVVGKTVQKS